MPFIQLSPAYNPLSQPQQIDPIMEFLSAAFGPDATQKPKQQSQPQQKPQPQFRQSCRAQCAAPSRQYIQKRLINPSFDVSELPDSYILEGELPGVDDKSSISISFDDAQTIVVKGEVKRAVRNAEPVVENTTSTSVPEKAVEEDTSSKHSVTVEEVADESDEFEVVEEPTPSSKADKGKQAATSTTDVEMTEAAPTTAAATPEQPKQIKPRYWIAERSIGVFERKFNFQGLIDQDGVKASLENGLLTVVVPKREKYVRQINIE